MAKSRTGESWSQQQRYTYPTALLRRLDTGRRVFFSVPSSALWSFAPPSFASNPALQVRHSSASTSSSSSAAKPTPPIPKPPRKPRKPSPKPTTTKKPIKDLPTRLRSHDGSTSLPALPEFQDLTRGARGLVRRSRAGAGAGGRSPTPIMTDGGRQAPRAVAAAAAAAASTKISEPSSSSSSSPSPALQQSPISQPSTSPSDIKISEPEPSASHSHSQSEPEPEPESGAEAYARAVARGEFPSTPLAKEIFMNIRAYEGDVLLTRVGMFYEAMATAREQEFDAPSTSGIYVLV
ncbi:hypothetical protein QFC21_005745 [Naganishia friedmannii]|uniref:Uncharacterized protein n=1 Tax=Naganishia friedmannii TaxID=89922 RepID=A0ACC2V7B0_9TREE|nr:hypothetical protein QFC21_005745 [Naganishia friedmannii]